MKVLLLNVSISMVICALLYILHQKIAKKKIVYKDLIKITVLVMLISTMNYFVLNYMITHNIPLDEDFTTGKPNF